MADLGEVLVKGAGDLASGTIRRLHLAGFKVVATEKERPLSVRRLVSFSEALWRGEHTVEDVTAVRSTKEEVEQHLGDGKVPILVDPTASILNERHFDILIDAIMAKRNTSTKITDAEVVIALGPGFTARVDCHAVVETLAGHDLGRVIYNGSASPNTGKPAPPEYYLHRESAGLPCCCSFPEPEALVLRAPERGEFASKKEIGMTVAEGDLLGQVENEEVRASASGVLRGLIHDGVSVEKGEKIGDIDPTGDESRCHTISEKSNAIAGGVLEAVLSLRK